MGKKRRNNGEGSIYQRKDGRWCGKYAVEGKRRYVYGSSRKEVAEKLFKAISESKSGFDFEVNGKVLVKDHLSSWLEDSVRGSVSTCTYERKEEIVRLHLVPSLGNKKLKNLLRITCRGFTGRNSTPAWLLGASTRSTAP